MLRSLRHSQLLRPLLSATALTMVMVPLAGCAASAQDGPSIRPSYTPDPRTPAASSGDYRNPPPEPSAPSGYDGRELPPPPEGYVPTPADAAQRELDQRYAAEAERWARENCVKSRGDRAGGALVGGILGAIVGSALGGRHDNGLGTVAGAAIGAVGGAAVADAQGGDTSPGCPAGYVVRPGSAPYAFAPDGYYYAAPGWYRPWVYVDGFWVYRPYPYHDWYFRTYRGPVRSYYGRPYGGYRGEPHHWRR